MKKRQPTKGEQSVDESRFRQAVADTGRGGGVSFLALLLGKGASSGLHVMLARFLEPAGYGLFALGRAIMNVGDGVARLGTDVGVVRLVSKEHTTGDKQEAAAIFQTAVVVTIAGSFVVAVILYFGAPLLNEYFEGPGFVTIMRWFAISLPAYALLTVMTSVLQARKYIFDQQTIIRLISPVIKISVIGGVFLLGWRLRGAVIAFAVSGVLSVAWSIWTIRTRLPELFSKLKVKFRTRKLLRYSIPVLLAGIGSMMAMRVDKILLGYLSTSKQIGIYAVAALIGKNITVIKAAIMPVLKPVISEIYEVDQEKWESDQFERFYQLVKRWTFVLTLIIILPIVAFPEVILQIFGNEYTSGKLVLVCFLGYGLVRTGVGPTMAGLKMTGHQDQELINGLILLVSVASLDYMLIPKFGALGAALGTLIATIIVETIRAVEIYRYHKFSVINKNHTIIMVAGLIIIWVAYIGSEVTFILKLAYVTVSAITLTVLFYVLREEDDKIVVQMVQHKILGNG